MEEDFASQIGGVSSGIENSVRSCCSDRTAAREEQDEFRVSVTIRVDSELSGASWGELKPKIATKMDF